MCQAIKAPIPAVPIPADLPAVPIPADLPVQAPERECSAVTREELSKHCTEDDLWVSIAGKVYDLTPWLSRHPGGELPLLAVAGYDATDVFRAMHPSSTWSMLHPFFVGRLEETPVLASLPVSGSEGSEVVERPGLSSKDLAMVADYRDLTKAIANAGLTRHDPSFYLERAAILAAVMAVIVYGVVGTTSVACHMLSAVALGLWWNQISFIGHDAGHNSITGDRSVDSSIGYFVGNALTGISIGWWKRSHNVHHIVCNSVNYDPDVQHVPVFAVSSSFFKSHYSFYHFRQMTFDALAQVLVSYQHLTFYPIMAVARINLYIQSLLLLFSSRPLDKRPLEAVTLLAFVSWYTLLLTRLPSFWEQVAFFFVSHAVSGILHVQICLSHFSSPTHEGRNDSALWFKTQLDGSMDVECSPWMDWFHGGLQFQIEHHLFPRVPRRNLRRIAPAVKKFCKKHDLPYRSADFWGCNAIMLGVLRQSAMEARELRKGVEPGKEETGADSPSQSFLQSLLWDAMNARG